MSEISSIQIELPLVALRGLTVMPDMIIHFDLSRDFSKAAVEHAMTETQQIFLVAQKNPEQDTPTGEDLYQYGTVALIKQITRLPNDIDRVLVEGQYKAKMTETRDNDGYFSAILEQIEDTEGTLDEVEEEALVRSLKDVFETYVKFYPKIGKSLGKYFSEKNKLSFLVNQVAINTPFTYEQKQQLLETTDLREQCTLLITMLINEAQIASIRTQLAAKLKEKIDKNQRDYILREQMKLIREELGEDNAESDADAYLEQLKKLKADKEVKEKIRKEILRFKNISGSSSESAVSRGYIETMLELPWNKASKDNKDLKNAERILNEDHYGLEKVKERMLEFLAVRNLTKKGESPIVCLVGPPGTGKTSIARSVARALDKKYVRISLGGVRDEAEIRGHRKTYVGAMPGRIVNGLRSAGVKNPLMLLDEIDKMSSDYKGDTASAMLEVLDAEQNCKFRDHYIEVPIDLSEVLFIATANSVQDIPRPLLDRMELIEVSGYIMEEKVEIAAKHLVPKQMDVHGLKKGSVKFPKKTLQVIVEAYTRESGVRELDKKIAKIMRKLARKVASDEPIPTSIKPEDLYEYLGAVEYSRDKYQGNDYAGVVTGLAWTAVGGEILFVESSLSKGKGSKLTLTGNLGDVMKESAMLALEYIHAHAAQFNINEELFENWNVHVHVPEGAIPKDGPSAGITMVTSLVSAFTQRKVKKNLAMTGEITLRGKVLPVGGIKEKILAAKRAGIKELILCKENEKDINEIKPEYLKGLVFHYVSDIQQVVDLALLREKVDNPLF